MTFCQAMVSRCATNWPPSEDKLAKEFVSFFQVGPFPSVDGWVQLCGSLDIQVHVCALPRELRGYHCCYDGTRSIWVNEEELFVGSREHSLLHELREILEHIFEDLGQPTVAKESLEILAEQFARLYQGRGDGKYLEDVLRGLGQHTVAMGPTGLCAADGDRVVLLFDWMLSPSLFRGSSCASNGPAITLRT